MRSGRQKWRAQGKRFAHFAWPCSKCAPSRAQECASTTLAISPLLYDVNGRAVKEDDPKLKRTRRMIGVKGGESDGAGGWTRSTCTQATTDSQGPGAVYLPKGVKWKFMVALPVGRISLPTAGLWIWISRAPGWRSLGTIADWLHITSRLARRRDLAPVSGRWRATPAFHTIQHKHPAGR